jgi:hypothetical protein
MLNQIHNSPKYHLPEQPYHLKSDNHAQVAKDNQGDMSFHVNHISPCISLKKILQIVLKLNN